MNFEKDFSPQGKCRVVQCQMSERSLEHRQRDIYETHKHRAYAVAYYMVGNEIEAEEVTQDTFVRAFRRAEEFADRAKKPLYAFPPSAERDALLALPDYVLSRDR